MIINQLTNSRTFYLYVQIDLPLHDSQKLISRRTPQYQFPPSFNFNLERDKFFEFIDSCNVLVARLIRLRSS